MLRSHNMLNHSAPSIHCADALSAAKVRINCNKTRSSASYLKPKEGLTL